MKSVVLAAGVASRLRPLTDVLPKCLLPVGGRPILERALAHQASLGIDEAIVVTGWLGERVRAAVGSWRLPLAVRFVDNPDYACTNNEYSLWLAAPHVAGDAFVMHDGDIVFDAAVLARVLAVPHANALALRRAADLGAEEMKARVDASGRVLEISKRIRPGDAAGEVPGVQRFSAATSACLYATLEARVCGRGLRGEWYEAALDELVRAGEPLHVVDVQDDYLAEIDTPEDLARVDAEVRGRDARAYLAHVG
jgi:choline kinase